MTESIKIDPFAEGVFRDLGYNTESDTHLLTTFIRYKRAKDFLQPGRLTADGYATIVALTEMSRRIGNLPAAAVPPSKPKPAPKKKDAEPVQKVETEVDTESPFGQD